MDVQARTEGSQSWQVPYKQYDGWHWRCPERVQPTKCSMAGETWAEMAALDMAAEISSVAARHCSLPLQCKCTSSGDHLKQVNLAPAAHCIARRSSRPMWSLLHQWRASWHCFKDNRDCYPRGRPFHNSFPPSPNVAADCDFITACASDSQDDDSLDIPRVWYPMHPTEHNRCIPHPTILRHYVSCIPEPSTGIPHVPRVVHHIRPIYHSRKAWGAFYITNQHPRGFSMTLEKSMMGSESQNW